MVRTQVQLTDEQLQALKQIAASEGVSVSEIVRRSIEHYVQSRRGPDWEEKRRRAIAAVGKYTAGVTDLSTEHDKYLAEAYAVVKKQWC